MRRLKVQGQSADALGYAAVQAVNAPPVMAKCAGDAASVLAAWIETTSWQAAIDDATPQNRPLVLKNAQRAARRHVQQVGIAPPVFWLGSWLMGCLFRFIVNRILEHLLTPKSED